MNVTETNIVHVPTNDQKEKWITYFPFDEPLVKSLLYFSFLITFFFVNVYIIIVL